MLLAAAPPCLAGGGPLGIDQELGYDNGGIWKRTNQEVLEYGVVAFEVGGALWEGGDSRFGRTLWQSIDASASSGIVALALKYGFSRVRPIDSGGDPNLWFKGHGNQSFPSGEVTLVSSVVTPLVLEYHAEQPWVYALELHAGWLMHSHAGTPFVLSVMPHGFYVGLSKRF